MLCCLGVGLESCLVPAMTQSHNKDDWERRKVGRHGTAVFFHFAG